MPDVALFDPEPSGDEQQVLLADIGRMTGLASAGEWQAVEAVATDIRDRIERLPMQQRQETLPTACAGFERVNALAVEARNAVGERIAAVRQGRKATDSYRATGTFRSAP